MRHCLATLPLLVYLAPNKALKDRCTSLPVLLVSLREQHFSEQRFTVGRSRLFLREGRYSEGCLRLEEHKILLFSHVFAIRTTRYSLSPGIFLSRPGLRLRTPVPPNIFSVVCITKRCSQRQYSNHGYYDLFITMCEFGPNTHVSAGPR